MALVHNSVGSNLLNGCCHEAERAERVGECLKALRHALPGRLHAHLDLLVVEIFTACRILRDLTDISQVYMARVPLVMGYINVILPSLAKTLMDIERHYSDKAKTREQRWRVMCHEMNEEIPGTPLPARFAMYNQYLNLLRMVLGKSPNCDFNILELLQDRILELRDAQDIAPPSPIYSPPGSWEDQFDFWEDDTSSHWAESIFTRPRPTRTKLDRPKVSVSQVIGPMERLGQPLMSRDAKILIKRSFDKDQISVTFFLQSSDEAPFVLIRKVQDGQPWVCMKGAHELCISRHDNATLNFTRWSRSDSCSKIWASLKFFTYEEMVLFYCTFVCLKARSVRKIDMHPREYVLRKEEKLFQATIKDDGFVHSLALYQDSYTGRHRLHATICDSGMKGCPVWTGFLRSFSRTSKPSWLSHKSRHRVWVRGFQPYIFCDSYRVHRQKKGRHGDFEIHFANETATEEFMEIFGPFVSSAGAIDQAH